MLSATLILVAGVALILFMANCRPYQRPAHIQRYRGRMMARRLSQKVEYQERLVEADTRINILRNKLERSRCGKRR